LAYLLTYRPGENFQRLLGDRGLGAGLTACFGAGSCLALLLLHVASRRALSGRLVVALIGAILIDIAAIVLSATRGAVLCSLAGVLVFAWMARRSRLLAPTLVLLILSFCCLVPLAKPYMPEAALDRLTTKEQSVDLRYDLARAMLGMVIEHPCGRVLGYENTKLSMDYSHNTFLQYVGEAGLLQTGPVLLILLYGVVRTLVRHRADLHVRALMLFGVPVLIESFSAGTAYDSLLWFLVFFIFSLREVPQHTTQSSYVMGSVDAPTPAWKAV
jgi:O-antigen ligase